MGLISPVAGGLTPPPDVARAIQLMKEAGFDGTVEYREERVFYPGGDYTYRSVTFEAWNGAKETYDAGLIARYPMITITEAQRIGLLAPNLNPGVVRADQPAPVVAPAPPVTAKDDRNAPNVSIFGGGAR